VTEVTFAADGVERAETSRNIPLPASVAMSRSTSEMSLSRSQSSPAAWNLKTRRWALMTAHVTVCALALGAMLLVGRLADPGGETIRGVPFYPLVIAGALAVVVLLTVMWLTWWQCPHCRSFLGQVFSLRRCPGCRRSL
jgi:hypothetical protein